MPVMSEINMRGRKNVFISVFFVGFGVVVDLLTSRSSLALGQTVNFLNKASNSIPIGRGVIPAVNSYSNNNNNNNNNNNEDLNFFRRVYNANLNLADILGSYKNVSAEVPTQLCKTKCKTAMALWVLQNLHPCQLIEKADCPKGLLCCYSRTVEEQIKRGSPTSLQDDYLTDNDHDPSSFIPVIREFDDKDAFYAEPILDPIPDDESSEILKV